MANAMPDWEAQGLRGSTSFPAYFCREQELRGGRVHKWNIYKCDLCQKQYDFGIQKRMTDGSFIVGIKINFLKPTLVSSLPCGEGASLRSIVNLFITGTACNKANAVEMTKPF